MVAVSGTERGMNHQGASWPRLTPEQADRVAANTGLVGHVLKMQRVRADEHDDRFQDGIIGLCRAAQMFDPTRGWTFATYAVYWIRQATMKGRDVEMGANYRRAYRDEADYVAPLSLNKNWDQESHVTEGNNETLLHTLADTRPDAERAALARAELAEVIARLAAWDLDRLDRAIADMLVRPSELSWSARDSAIADEFRVHEVAVRNRRYRLQACLRGEAALPSRTDGRRFRTREAAA